MLSPSQMPQKERGALRLRSMPICSGVLGFASGYAAARRMQARWTGFAAGAGSEGCWTAAARASMQLTRPGRNAACALMALSTYADSSMSDMASRILHASYRCLACYIAPRIRGWSGQ